MPLWVPSTPSLTTGSAPHVVFLGDSLTSRGVFSNSTELGYNNIGYPAWTAALAMGAIYSQPSDNIAVVGYTTAQVLANQVAPAIALAPATAVVMAGRNDAMAGTAALPDTTAGTITYNLRQIYDQLQAAGIVVVAVKILSQTYSEWTSGADELLALQVNAWIDQQRTFRKGFYVIDAGNTYDDQTNTTHWQPKANYIDSSDNTHPTTWGAYVIGNQLASLFTQLWPVPRLGLQNVDDVYNATNNPYGDQLSSPMFTGTGGSTSGGASGTVASGWTLYGTNLIGASGAGSKGTTADGRQTQILTVSGTANGSNGKLQLAQTLTAGHFNAGDTVEFTIDASWGSTTNIAAVNAFMQFTESGTTYTYDAAKNSIATGSGYTLPTNSTGGPAGSVTTRLRTPRHTCTAAPTAVTAYVEIDFITPLSSAAVAGTFTFSSPSVKKIPPASA